jgi:heat shock protein HtpX
MSLTPRLLNTVRLTTLFAVLIALFGIMGYLFFGTSGLIMGLLFAGVMNTVTYFFSDRIVVKMQRAQPVSATDAPDLHAMVERLADDAGIPKPRLYMMQTDTPNAFATGRNPENGVVCVTSGLLNHLSQDEVEGVIAHEIGHIKNRDTLIQAVAGTVAGAISVLAQMMWFSTLSGENRHPAFMLGGIILAPVAATMVKMAISRSREYTADRTAASLTNPQHLANALRSIETAVSQRPMKQGVRGTSHMFIINPFRGDAMAKLFSTHPPTEERIQRLEQYA